jgi:putative redox protein
VKATARRTASGSYTHRIDVRQHSLTADEPVDQGGADQGPTPQELLAASLAGCTAITAEMYARRKGWELERIEVTCEYEQPERGDTTRFSLTLRLPESLTPEQAERLQTIAAKCPVHRTLEAPVEVADRVELVPLDEV